MEQLLDKIKADAVAELKSVSDDLALQQFKVKYFGKKGAISQASAGMRDVPKDQKPLLGKKLNEVREGITSEMEKREREMIAAQDAAAVKDIDLTLPGRPLPPAGMHPLTLLRDRAVRIFRRLGFALAEGPDIETEWHCFDALHTPPDHPARNEKDTFYFDDGRLLRTHTSTVQVRTMEKSPPPVRIVAPGAAYRRDEIDATHSLQFTQIEGLYVDRDVSLADLKGTLEFFFQGLLGRGTEVRFRPHFFPFTEPSLEIDVKLVVKGEEARWIEIAGCGMVDPAVFEAICQARGDDLYDPGKVTGFAFGMGIDRLAMTLWGIPDIRLFVENDQRFLAQFSDQS